MDRADREIVNLTIYRSPVQFSLVAELDHAVSPEELTSVLAVLQDRHPVLGVAVGRAGPEAVVQVPSGVIPIEVVTDGTPWEYIVAAEQTRPIPPASGPPARAVLVPGNPGCAVVLIVAHQIIDDAYGPRTVLDLITALGGQEPGPGGDPRPHRPARGPRSGRWWTTSP